MSSPASRRARARRPLSRRAVLAGAVAGLAGLALAGCRSGLSADGEPLTIAQSERLAAARFQLASNGPFVATVTTGATDDVARTSAQLTCDPSAHRAWGVYSRGPVGLEERVDIALGASAVAIRRSGEDWTPVAQPTPGILSLGVLFSLTTDRPENAQLLRQSDARYLGSQELDGRTLDVYRMPSASTDGAAGAAGAGSPAPSAAGAAPGGRSRLWLDGDGRIRRLDDGRENGLVATILDAQPDPPPAELDRLAPAS